MDAEEKAVVRVIATVATVVVLAVGGGVTGCMWGMPKYAVYEQEMKGRAAFARANQDRQIKVREAEATLATSRLTAQAEVERAMGTDKANRIMAQSLGGPDNYLRWAYVDMLRDTAGKDRTVIYLPTEAAMPILEAGKR